MAEKRLFKEYNKLVKSPASSNNQEIQVLQPIDVDNIFEWEATICKPSLESFYYGGKWDLKISVSPQYPIQPPTIKFSRATPISHPNINFDSGEICLDILKLENWSPAWNLEHLVGAILMLIDDPEPDSPLNIDLANLFRSDKVGFRSLVQFIIWKYHTHSESRDLQGIISSDQEFSNLRANKEVDLPKEDEEAEESVDEDVEEDTELIVEYGNEAIIKDVGKQVTQGFMDKVDEIKHSKENSLDSTKDYDDAKRHIVENVNKQVNELCLKSGSPELGLDEKTKNIDANVDTASIDDALREEKKKFLDEIDKKMNAFQDGATISTTSTNTVKSASGSTKSKKKKRDRLKEIIKKI